MRHECLRIYFSQANPFRIATHFVFFFHHSALSHWSVGPRSAHMATSARLSSPDTRRLSATPLLLPAPPRARPHAPASQTIRTRAVPIVALSVLSAIWRRLGSVSATAARTPVPARPAHPSTIRSAAAVLAASNASILRSARPMPLDTILSSAAAVFLRTWRVPPSTSPSSVALLLFARMPTSARPQLQDTHPPSAAVNPT